MLSYYLARLFKKFNPVAKRRTKLHPSARVGGGTQIIDSSMGQHSYCGYDCVILKTNIGAFCSIATNVKIGLACHPLEWVSASSEFYGVENTAGRKLAVNQYDSFPYVTNIGNDVWIGENVMVKPGVSIGDGAVIGMGSVVTKDIGPYEVWAGNPARFIRKRFDEETISGLLETKWWNWDDETLSKYAPLIPDTKQFLQAYYNSIGDKHE